MGADFLPMTGHIDFEDARLACKRLHKQVVISRVDEAANCLSVMCKACYKRVAEAELNGEGYERIGGADESAETVLDRTVASLSNWIS